MNHDEVSELPTQFLRFRQGHLSVEALQDLLASTVDALSPVSDLHSLLEQANARLDFIVWGVCEAERDAHINDLLQELETKLTTIEP